MKPKTEKTTVKLIAEGILNRIFNPDAAAETAQPTGDEIQDEAAIKDQVVKEILAIRQQQVDAWQKSGQLIEQLALDARERLNQLTGSELEADDSFCWFSIDELINVKLTASRYAVPTESWHQAKALFADMLNKHGLTENPELKPFLDLANAAFALTEGGRADTKAIASLRKARFDMKKYPEWRLVKAFLADSVEYVSRKSQFSIATRESKKHYWQKIGDKRTTA